MGRRAQWLVSVATRMTRGESNAVHRALHTCSGQSGASMLAVAAMTSCRQAIGGAWGAAKPPREKIERRPALRNGRACNTALTPRKDKRWHAPHARIRMLTITHRNNCRPSVSIENRPRTSNAGKCRGVRRRQCWRLPLRAISTRTPSPRNFDSYNERRECQPAGRRWRTGGSARCCNRNTRGSRAHSTRMSTAESQGSNASGSASRATRAACARAAQLQCRWGVSVHTRQRVAHAECVSRGRTLREIVQTGTEAHAGTCVGETCTRHDGGTSAQRS